MAAGTPPAAPTKVFLGEISGKSFFGNRLPSPQPKRYAPMSEDQIMTNRQSRIEPSNPPGRYTSGIVSATGSAM